MIRQSFASKTKVVECGSFGSLLKSHERWIGVSTWRMIPVQRSWPFAELVVDVGLVRTCSYISNFFLLKMKLCDNAVVVLMILDINDIRWGMRCELVWTQGNVGCFALNDSVHLSCFGCDGPINVIHTPHLFQQKFLAMSFYCSITSSK